MALIRQPNLPTERPRKLLVGSFHWRTVTGVFSPALSSPSSVPRLSFRQPAPSPYPHGHAPLCGSDAHSLQCKAVCAISKGAVSNGETCFRRVGFGEQMNNKIRESSLQNAQPEQHHEDLAEGDLKFSEINGALCSARSGALAQGTPPEGVVTSRR